MSVLIQFSAVGGSQIHSENRLHRPSDCGAVPPRPHARCGTHWHRMETVQVMKLKFRNSEIFLRFSSISFNFLIFLQFFWIFIIFFGGFPEKIKTCWQHYPRKLGWPPGSTRRNSETLGASSRFLRAKTLQFRFSAILGPRANRRKIEGNWRKSKENITFLLETR